MFFTSTLVGHCFVDSSSSDDDYYYYYYAPSNTSTENAVSSMLSKAVSRMKSSIKASDSDIDSASISAHIDPPHHYECYYPNGPSNSYYYDDSIPSSSSSSSSSSRKLSAGSQPSSQPSSQPTSTPTLIVDSYILDCVQREPQIILTEGETCSSYIYAMLLESTCLVPSDTDAFQLAVSQTIDQCSYADDYLPAQGLYDKTFRQAIITSLQPSIPSINGSSIIDFLVSPSSTAVAATSIRSRQLQTPSVVISYTLQSASVSYLT
jgi:hypothetical protein